jgi:hypothetical protein
MKMIFLQSLRKTRSIHVAFLKYNSAYSVCRAQERAGWVAQSTSEPAQWVIANSEIQVGRLHKSSLSRAHAHHLIAHATIVPSPYQDSLRRDGGQARWELGTRHHACQFVSGSVRSHFRGLERAHALKALSSGGVVIPNPSQVTEGDVMGV